MRTLMATAAAFTLTFGCVVSAAAGTSAPDAGPVARISVVGDLFGPAGAADAAYLLFGDQPTEVWSADPQTLADSEPTSLRAETRIGDDQVQMHEGHEHGFSGVPAEDASQPDWASGRTMPGDGTAAQVVMCPVVGGASFTDTWGAERPGALLHEGSDLFADRGTPVVAMAGGVLVRVDREDRPGSLGGKAVSYVTADGDRWYNAHLDEVPAGLRLGQYVEPGTVIGSVGTTGNAKGTPPHLHIEWHPGGGAARPNYELLRAACS